MAGISDKALKGGYQENKYRFNDGTELANKEFSDGSGLEMYETSFRGYDPQLGRFWQIDPLAEVNDDVSPYAFVYNNPILFNDPVGLDSSKPATLKPVTVTPGNNYNGPQVVNTKGPAPNVGGSVGPAPTRVAPPIPSDADTRFEKMFPNEYNFQYQQDHMIVREKTFWEGLSDNGDGGILMGYNWKGEAVRQFYYGGTPGAEAAFPEGEAAEGAVTIFENISKRIRDKSTINFLVKMKAAQFEAALAKAANQAWKMTADGKAKILIYNGLKYVSRLATTGEATVDIYRGEELVQKYRLLH